MNKKGKSGLHRLHYEKAQYYKLQYLPTGAVEVDKSATKISVKSVKTTLIVTLYMLILWGNI